MYAAQRTTLADGHGLHLTWQAEGRSISFGQAIDLWHKDGAFRTLFIEELSACAFSAYRWETPPISEATLERPFECVLLDAPEIDRRADRRAFSPHFENREPGDIVAFDNLGGDACMVVPVPGGAGVNYCHLASFVRTADREQVHALWAVVGRTAAERVGARPMWISTAGCGVAWLHVRMVSRPKYYGHAAYRSD